MSVDNHQVAGCCTLKAQASGNRLGIMWSDVADVAEVSLDLLTAAACARHGDGESAQISNALSFTCAGTSAVAFSEMPRTLETFSRCVYSLVLEPPEFVDMKQ